MSEWYYSEAGQQRGPVGLEELSGKLARGEVRVGDLVWKEGMPGWVSASQVPELSLVPGGQVVLQGSNSTGLTQPPAYQGVPPVMMVPSYLVPSIIALVISVMAMLLFCLQISVPFAVVALVYAARVDGLKAQGNLIAATSASNTAKVWMILSYSFLGLQVIAGIVILAFVIANP